MAARNASATIFAALVRGAIDRVPRGSASPVPKGKRSVASFIMVDIIYKIFDIEMGQTLGGMHGEFRGAEPSNGTLGGV
jgi:hypothetical protein